MPEFFQDASEAIALIELTALAERVLGSPTEAGQWLVAPAVGLDGRRPMDLIATSTGAEMVRAHLIRMDYGVYV